MQSMLQLIISILAIFITIFFVIGSHEFAHFLVARRLGVKVKRFSIGFGKTLFHRFDKQGTEYVVALIPLGGYVKMLDEHEDVVTPEEKHLAFNNQPYYKKILIVLAGPFANLMSALILYWIIFMIGFNAIKPIIGSVNATSLAAAANLKANQEIIKADDHEVYDWGGFIFRLILHAGDKDEMKLVTLNEKKLEQQHILNLADWKLEGLSPDPLASIGIKPYSPTIPLVIGRIAKDSPAVAGGLQVNDKLIAINNQPIKDWQSLIKFIINQPNQKVLFTLERANHTLTIPVTVGYQRNLLLQKYGYLGIEPDFKWPKELLFEIKYQPLPALVHAFKQINQFISLNFILIGKLLVGKLSLQTLGGPIAIFDIASNTLNVGVLSFLIFLAFFSIAIGVINLLPIPGLDGGHLLLQTIECIIQRPIPEKMIEILYRFGFLLIFGVLCIAVINDLLRL